jgi:uncharacterized membrane protein YhdT
MSRERIIVTAVLLTGGIVAVLLTIFFTVVFVLAELNPPDRGGHVLWGEVALYLIPLAFVGVGLIWLGVNYSRGEKG